MCRGKLLGVKLSSCTSNKLHRDTGLEDFALVKDDDLVGVDHQPHRSMKPCSKVTRESSLCRCKLLGVKMSSCASNKFHRDTGLDDFALVEDDDLVGVDHRGEPVRDHDRRPPLRYRGTSLIRTAAV